MSRVEFTADKQGAYVAGVAEALSVAPSRVAIASITDRSTRRRLLASSVAVSTTVIVPKDKVAGVAVLATAENLNRALASSGISVGAVSSSTTPDGEVGTGTAADSAEASFGGLGVAGLAGIVAGGAVLVLLVAAAAIANSRRKQQEHSRRAQQEFMGAGVELPSFAGLHATDPAAPSFYTAMHANAGAPGVLNGRDGPPPAAIARFEVLGSPGEHVMCQQRYGQQFPFSGQMPPPGMGGPQLPGAQQQGFGGQIQLQSYGQPLQPPPYMPVEDGFDGIPAQGQPTPAAHAGALPPINPKPRTLNPKP
ncbi:hypothetical protein T484DRAFT_2526584 [Baffinella frigidus]|nr:hypothetical protein T484DRAFT_2526584 [Cryptophyta sp. CCMP2293]